MSLHPLLLVWRALEIGEHLRDSVGDRICLGYHSVLNLSQAALEVLLKGDIFWRECHHPQALTRPLSGMWPFPLHLFHDLNVSAFTVHHVKRGVSRSVDN